MELLSYINNITKPIPIDVTLPTAWTSSSLTARSINHSIDDRGYFTTMGTTDLRVGTNINDNVYTGSSPSSITLDSIPTLAYDPASVPSTIATTIASGTLMYAEPLRMAPSVTEEFRNEILQSVSDAIRDACEQFIGRPNNQVTASSIANEVARILRSDVAATASTDSTGRVTLSIPMPDYMDGIELNISPDIYEEDSS